MNTYSHNFFLIRGLGKSSKHWGDLIPHLQELYPHSRIITLEVPGNGDLNKQKTPGTIEQIVLNMRAQYLSHDSFNRADSTTKNHLIAISLGGMIATHWLNKFEADFDLVTLMNTSNTLYSHPLKRLKPQALWTLAQVAISSTPKKKEATTLKLISNNTKNRNRVLNSWTQIAKSFPVSNRNLFYQILAGSRFKQTPSWKIPTQLLVSKNDRMVSYTCSEAIHKKHHYSIYYHPTAGHAITLDAPEWVARKIQSWTEGEDNKEV